MPECHSTNTLALELSQNSAIAEGTIVITDNQTAGRGQRGSSWQAEAGKNLTFSIVLKPVFLEVKNQFFLTVVTALAISDFLREKMLDFITIKWPNDILVHEKKICGVLIENQVQGRALQTAVVGIGLNVNQIHFPVSTAGSIAQFLSHELSLNDVLSGLVSCLEARYLQLRQGKFDVLKHEYLLHLHWKGEQHFFETEQGVFSGVIVGVDEHGRLAVEVEGKLAFYDVKQIRFLK